MNALPDTPNLRQYSCFWEEARTHKCTINSSLSN